MAIDGNMAGFNHPIGSCRTDDEGDVGGTGGPPRRPRLVKFNDRDAIEDAAASLSTFASTRSSFASATSSSSSRNIGGRDAGSGDLIGDRDRTTKAITSREGKVSSNGGTSLAKLFSKRLATAIATPSIRRLRRRRTLEGKNDDCSNPAVRKISTFDHDSSLSRRELLQMDLAQMSSRRLMTRQSLVVEEEEEEDGDGDSGVEKETGSATHSELNDGRQQHAASDEEVHFEEETKISSQRRRTTINSGAKKLCSFIEKNRLFDESEEGREHDLPQIYTKEILPFAIMLLLPWCTPLISEEFLPSLGRGLLTLLMFMACLGFMVVIQLVFSLDNENDD